MTLTANTYAVRAQRVEPRGSLDDFPTQPWAVRALFHHILLPRGLVNKEMSCLDPACNRGFMSRTLGECFDNVSSFDVENYGYKNGSVRDFLLDPFPEASFDWVITNPPFCLANAFVLEALRVSRFGVAILARTQFVEGRTRYEYLFSKEPPDIIGFFVENVPLIRGKCDKKTSYSWFVWDRRIQKKQPPVWIPPCRKELERPGDYDLPEGVTS